MAITAFYLTLLTCSPTECHYISAATPAYCMFNSCAPYADFGQCVQAGQRRVRDNPRWKGFDCVEKGLER